MNDRPTQCAHLKMRSDNDTVEIDGRTFTTSGLRAALASSAQQPVEPTDFPGDLCLRCYGSGKEPTHRSAQQQQPVSAEERLKRANLLIASIPYTEYQFSAQIAYVEKERAERYARTLLLAALSPPQAEPGKGDDHA